MAEYRRAWAEIDLDALASNVALLSGLVAPARLCAVLKADAYGHGALLVAPHVLASGATMLAVALVEEGIELREAGITAPILLLSEPPLGAMHDAVAQSLTLTLYSPAGIAAAGRAAAGQRRKVAVHLKVDTGMHRVGAALAELEELGQCLLREDGLYLEGLWSHLAIADQRADPFTAQQAQQLREARQLLGQLGLVPEITHLANSAGALAHPATRLDLVRCGIALYGYLPAPELSSTLADELGAPMRLQPVLSLKAEVAHVRRLSAGERISYGLRYELAADSLVATVPLGYRDGVPRLLGERGGAVLIGGQRCPLAGTVTMDQIIIDCGAFSGVQLGDEVVLLGRQGEEQIDAWEWAERLDTIAYEVLCGIGARVPRRAVGRGLVGAKSTTRPDQAQR